MAERDGKRIKPLIPVGFSTGVFPDETPPVASLTIDTKEGSYTFAINNESCAILKEVVAHLETVVNQHEAP
ncbi:hypothetical protein ASD50_04005 [Mesorhizobium sp. Root552]|jgi:hypothetical protein|uniref:hypothetical protein n=1 Tax=Mesorhizobium sp. Root552 TaxID=1736555 RepID=UPI0006F926DB|nr:hypothetical protein [Mesorhizobium sp. Root552]KQZ26575.1 hypothetical protein ASD50_04005 [Mesorhizobium sp. Root552]